MKTFLVALDFDPSQENIFKLLDSISFDDNVGIGKNLIARWIRSSNIIGINEHNFWMKKFSNVDGFLPFLNRNFYNFIILVKTGNGTYSGKFISENNIFESFETFDLPLEESAL